jgi:hypothetical protein
MHRVEQTRHQCQPLALTFPVMIKDVFRHPPNILHQTRTAAATLVRNARLE